MRGLSRLVGDRPGPAPEVPSRRPEPASAPLAVLTMARDEGPMLRRWVEHYARQVGAEHLVVVDDGTTDGSTDDLPCPVLRLPPITRPFERTRMGVLSGLARGLLEAYDAVLFADADELVVADPDRWTDLGHLVRERPEALALGALGLNVLHARDEAPLDPDAPVLGQRHHATFVPLMCKPALKWVAADWVAASHGLRAPYAVDPDLYLFHLKFADRDHLRAVADRRRAMVRADGRAAGTSWSKGPEEMLEVLDRAAARLARSSPETFRAPAGADLDALVVPGDDPGVWRAPKGGQVQAMVQRPAHRLADRFLGLL